MRRCSRTTDRSTIQGLFSAQFVGAGEGNRTLVVSLGSFCSTIELHPRRGSIVPTGGGKSRGETGRPYRVTTAKFTWAIKSG
jgi:hypothetical protein